MGVFDLAEDLNRSIDVAVHQESHGMSGSIDPLP
jgi:hypothetical protein